jgi:CBS domain-containing protein
VGDKICIEGGNMTARDLIQSKPKPVTIRGQNTIYESMQLMTERKIGSLIVTDQNKNPIGIITENDIFQLAFETKGKMMELMVSDHMSTDLILGVLDDDIDFIAEVMIRNNIQHVPIMDEDERLCGVISTRDIVNARLMMAADFQK